MDNLAFGVAPSSFWVAPSSFWVAPSSFWVVEISSSLVFWVVIPQKTLQSYILTILHLA